MDSRLAQWRLDTPGCSTRIHLNNAGAALMPTPVISAIVEHIEREANIGGYEAEARCAGEIQRVYGDIATLLQSSERNVAVVPNATAGFVQALSAFDFAPGDALVTSRCDYTSNQIQYLALQRRRGVQVLHAADLPEGGVDPDSIRAIVRQHRCRLVALSWVPTNSGLVQDAPAVGAVCQENGVSFLLDACQAVGQIPIDVGQLRCDYLSVTARKFLRGPRGIGFLYVSDAALARGDYPLHVDMRGARWTTADNFVLNATARRFEDWESSYALVLGLGAAVRYALDVGLAVAQERSWKLAAYTRRRLSELPGVRIFDRGQNLCAIVTAAVDGWPASAVAKALSAQRINTSVSLREYAIHDFDAKGVESVVRISPHYYNDTDEIDRLAAAIENRSVG